MVLQLSVATADDAEEIASIHLATFDGNILLHAQFPTEVSLASLHECLKQDVIETVKTGNPDKIDLVVRDTEIDQIISFAKYDLPSISVIGDDHAFSELWPPKESRRDLLEKYATTAEAAKKRVLGVNPCYRMTFVGTRAEHRGRGAATLLVNWGLSKAREENLPLYLESTVPASRLYRKLGFVAEDGFSLALPGTGTDGQPYIYEELCMVRRWDIEEGMDRWDSSLNIPSLLMDYEVGITPQLVVQAIYDRIEAYKEVQSCVWIYLRPIGEVMQAAHALYTRWPDASNRPPLWGVPFSVKDSINVAGIPTTTGCPALAFTPTSSAPVFQHCIDAGGLFIGKTNMEQLATGMTGCRSPFGTLHSTFSKSHIVGGSSSGSAVSVSENLVSFSLGSDTAGSIRVPALFNGLVGFKPTKGTVSARGVSPACLHQDTVSFLAVTTEDAETVWKVCEGYDKADFFAKPSHLRQPFLPLSLSNGKTAFRFGTPPASALEACSSIYRRQFAVAVSVLKSLGGKAIEINWSPFALANDLLYNGTFVLERLTTLPEGWFDKNKDLLHPTIREVFEGVIARKSSAVDVFRDLHKQAEYKRLVEDILTYDEKDGITVMIVPSAPFHPTIEEVSKDPIGINLRLGAFAHFANVLDLVGVAVPCGTYEEKGVRLPFGITVLAGTGLDGQLLELSKLIEGDLGDLE
ncbi:allophanate hydrolase protein [Rutstroemia sp. NJR-2017a WRK4]|nr:allophanate hydrolase protein [Rutstroemia sp. NJR-2017a WRK4]